MSTISALEVQKHDPQRVNVFVDGKFVCGVSAMVALERGLVTGLDVSDADVEALQQDDQMERAYGAALNFLSYRPRSSREVLDYFRRKKMDESVAQSVLERLQSNGLVNDAEFAQFWVDNRQSFRPRGSRALRVELRRKGIDTEVIDHALDDLGDEADAAFAAGTAKIRSYNGLSSVEFHQKMTSFLQRRGFPYRVAAIAARRLGEEAQLEFTVVPEEEIEGD